MCTMILVWEIQYLEMTQRDKFKLNSWGNKLEKKFSLYRRRKGLTGKCSPVRVETTASQLSRCWFVSRDVTQLWFGFTRAMLCCWALLLRSAGPFPDRPTSFQVPAESAVLPAPSHSGGCLQCSQFVQNRLGTPEGPPPVLTNLWNPIHGDWNFSAWVYGYFLSPGMVTRRPSMCIFLRRGYIGFIRFTAWPPCPLLSSQLIFSECFPRAWCCCKRFAWVLAQHYCGGLPRWDVLAAPSIVCEDWNNTDIAK